MNFLSSANCFYLLRTYGFGDDDVELGNQASRGKRE